MSSEVSHISGGVHRPAIQIFRFSGIRIFSSATQYKLPIPKLPPPTVRYGATNSARFAHKRPKVQLPGYGMGAVIPPLQLTPAGTPMAHGGWLRAGVGRNFPGGVSQTQPAEPCHDDFWRNQKSPENQFNDNSGRYGDSASMMLHHVQVRAVFLPHN